VVNPAPSNPAPSNPAPVATPAAKVAPLDDEELLAAVQRAFRHIIIPELERLGAEEFVVSQVRSCLSMLSYVGRGLHDRQVARAQADVALGALLAGEPARAPLPPAVRDLLLHRLDQEIATRTGS
jgi:hypothetical protein